MIVYGTNYKRIPNYLPSTYMWLIRHFLGLLPIPLLPQFSNNILFEWNRLSDQCQDYLKNGRSFNEDSNIINYFIVE